MIDVGYWFVYYYPCEIASQCSLSYDVFPTINLMALCIFIFLFIGLILGYNLRKQQEGSVKE